EENTPESTDAASTHELDQNVREILFEEEGPDAAPTAALQKEFELETPAAEPAAAENEEAPANESPEEDLFFGWTQTTKTYSSLNIEDEEKQETTAEAAPEIQDEDEENQPAEVLTEEVAEVTAEDKNEDEAEAEEGAVEVVAEAEEAEATNEPILSEDGSLRITLNTYKHPTKGFGFGLLEDSEETEEAETEEVTEETVEETAQAEAPEEDSPAAEEPEAPVAPDGLDSWGSLAFELGLPVTVPESAPKASALKAPAKVKKEEKPSRSAKEEKTSKSRRSEESAPKTESKIVIDLDDEDLISPENVFAVSEKETRSNHGAGPDRSRRDERQAVSDFGLKQVPIPEMDENAEAEMPRRRRRRGNASQESSANEKKSEAISAIVAGVVASKAKDEAEKSGRKSGKGRAERSEFQEEDATVSRRERSHRSRRAPVEEVPQDDFVVADEDFTNQAVQQDEDEETAIPNGARSRRRRRAQHDKMEQTKARAAAQTEEEDVENEAEEVSFQPKKRSRRDGRNRFREELED
ncbi:MAG: hypothetical protein IJK97_15470, partial [Thermoguttaceae bacterium]|nr:hypothetical protein [Thermoguttaceae bacterium]